MSGLGNLSPASKATQRVAARSAQRGIATAAHFTAGLFYRIDRIGAAVPPGPVLLVANHPNSMLDPAVVWTTSGRDVRFLAKSPLFRGVSGVLLRAARGIPVYRRMDAGEDLSRNAEMFAAVEAALADGDAVCLFPEGTTHSTGRLEQLRTGAARIALSSAANGTETAIVPIGLNFDHKTAFRSRATIAYGAAFRCDDLVGVYRNDAPAAVRALTDRIATRMRGLIVEADPRSHDEVVARIDRLYTAARRLDRDSALRLERRRIIARALERLRADDAARVDDILQRVRAYDAALARFGLRERDVDASVPPGAVVRFVLRELVYAAALLPVAMAGAALFAPPYLVTDLVARWYRQIEVQATVKALAGALVYLMWIAGLTVVAGVRLGWFAALASLVTLPLLGVVTLFALERELSVVGTARAYLATRSVPRGVRQRLSRRRAAIVDVLEDVYEWIEQGDEPAGISRSRGPSAFAIDASADSPEPCPPSREALRRDLDEARRAQSGRRRSGPHG